MLTCAEHVKYITEFIDTYKKYENSIYDREIECQRVRFRYVLGDIEEGDYYAGRYRDLAIGFAPQENGMDYFFNEDAYHKLYQKCDGNTQNLLDHYMDYWKNEITMKKVRDNYPAEIAEILDSDGLFTSAGVAFPLYRMSGTHPDYGKLVKLGIPGFIDLLEEKYSTAKDESRELYKGLLRTIELLKDVCASYRDEAAKRGFPEIADTLENIINYPPRNLREAIQLIHLFAILSGSFNYGRLDVTLGDFVNENEEEMLDCLIGFWKLINARNCIWDGRIIVGGKGRSNEEKADKFALLAIKASRLNNDILPQLTLRFYDEQNPDLLQAAYDNFTEGCVYPLLYRDEINIPAVVKAFGVDEQTAQQFVPFGCGEYVIDHQSMGTPSGIINLLKALEVTLFEGRDLVTGKQMGISYPFHNFEEFFEAYKKNVERYIDALAVQEKIEYDVTAKIAPHLFLTLLFDDCIERGKAIFDGGVRYLGGTLESYGNTNTSDSLTAIKQLVFEKKVFSIEQLRLMLRNDFRGYERERQMLINCPKYGNDNEIADEMAVRVHEHVCNYTRQCAKKVGLHSYLIVIINNNANSTFGLYTGASADGRFYGEPMANANNPSGGMDKNGVTAFLNSLVKLDNSIHAGAVQNMKFTKEMFIKYRDKMEFLLKAYFQKGQQAMLNILDKGVLEDALIHPEKYPDLIVRVGGFAARFIELDRKTQEEIVSRTLYGNDI